MSGFAEYATVSRRSLVKIDKELPLEEAALFGCAVLTGVGAVAHTARIPVGSSVAVIGLGGVGFCSLLVHPHRTPCASWFPVRSGRDASAHLRPQAER